jgi:hypothetical protein
MFLHSMSYLAFSAFATLILLGAGVALVVYYVTTTPALACPKCKSACEIAWRYKPRRSLRVQHCTNTDCNWERLMSYELNGHEGSRFVDPRLS